MSRQKRLNKSMDTLFPQEAPDACRVCNEPVVDGRWNYCSERCREVAQAVQKMFIWESVRDRVLERDDYTCQSCGLSKEHEERAYWQTHELARELSNSTDEFWNIWRSYGVTDFGNFNVDHITRLADGGHPFDESNLQTLCECCHHEKTAEENRRESAEQRPELGLDAYL